MAEGTAAGRLPRAAVSWYLHLLYFNGAPVRLHGVSTRVLYRGRGGWRCGARGLPEEASSSGVPSPPLPSAGRTSQPPTSSAAQQRLRPEGPLPHRAVHAEPVPREPPSVEAFTTLRLQAAPSSPKSRGTSLRR